MRGGAGLEGRWGTNGQGEPMSERKPYLVRLDGRHLFILFYEVSNLFLPLLESTF